MQALYVANGELQYRHQHPQPEPKPGEALIRLLLMGICSTDLEIVKGYVPGFDAILGHEFVGIVEQADDDSWVGKRVVGTINLGCQQCAICLGHGAEHCPHRTVLGIIGRDGVFADYVTLPLTNLLEVPTTVSDKEAVFTEPLAAALRIREQLLIQPTARIAVVGPGRLGLLIGQVLALAGTAVTMLGRRPESLLLPEQLGLEIGITTEYEDNSFDVVVEATGNEAGLQQALRLTRPLGTLVMKSTYAGRAQIDLTKLVVDEITVIGSRCGPFAPALRLLAEKKIAVQEMVEADYALRDGLTALEYAARPGVRKVILRP
ncbi:MAG TPA: alcohol dehydrogenase catalytic domain-containing protein [Anaerolineae bacterium]|nr:alcohol dehydrogenase catalytic domain-containing protein [Anaerolineae bacterium]